MVRALRISAAGQQADIAKPMKGFGVGVFEISVAYRGDAYRVVYAVRIDDDIWVIDAFQKKSKQGTRTPKRDVERIRSRLSWLREQLK